MSGNNLEDKKKKAAQFVPQSFLGWESQSENHWCSESPRFDKRYESIVNWSRSLSLPQLPGYHQFQPGLSFIQL